MRCYIEITEVVSDGAELKPTGYCEEYDSWEEAKIAFDARQTLEVDGGTFAIDLYKGPEDIEDTIMTNAEGLLLIPGYQFYLGKQRRKAQRSSNDYS